MLESDLSAAEQLYRLVGATIRLSHRLNWAAQRIHAQGRRSGGRRGILRSLAEAGPQTVPQMARVRPVTRQHIQGLVSELAEDGLVGFRDNPAHKRSRFVALTAAGEREAAAMQAREMAAYSRLATTFSAAELAAATELLIRLTDALAGGRWRRKRPAGDGDR